MNDLISRQKAIQDFCHEYCGCETEECPLTHEHDGAEECSVVRFLKNAASADPSTYKTDLISRQAATAHLKHRLYETQFNNDTEHPYYAEIADNRIDTWINELPSVQPEQKWILVKARPMDNEERLEWSEKLGYTLNKEEAVIYTSQLPDDGQEVLVCGRSGRVWIDTFENDLDYGCCFEENGDMDGIIAWMPLPEPPKEE